MVICKKGSSGPDVKRLQRLLNAILIPSPELTEDGDFGQKTHDAVVAFQKQALLTSDGVVGPKTWTALGQKFAVTPAPPPQSPPAPPSGGVSSWMEIAENEMGVSENALPGEHNKRIVEYHSATSLKATTDETPWCSSFVNWVMKKSGRTGTNSALAKSWLDWTNGSAIEDPLEGAVVVIKKKGASSDAATGSSTGFHVGFYVSHNLQTIRILGGNQGDQVKYSNFYLSGYDVKGYRWPN